MNADLKKAGLSLFELGQTLGLAPPSHGYTIAEKAPEIVTAPGVYFPIKKGRVIPLKPMQEGGEVDPNKKQTMLERMLDESNIVGPETAAPPVPAPTAPLEETPLEPNPALETYSGPYGKGESIPGIGGIAREWTGPRPWRQNLSLFSRQGGGLVNPALFKDKYSFGKLNPLGDQLAQDNLLSKAPDTSGQSLITPMSAPKKTYYDVHPEENQLPPSPPPISSASISPQPNLGKVNLGDIRPLISFAPPKFKENRQSPIFRSDQEVSFNKKNKRYLDVLRTLQGEIPLIARQAGGGVSPSISEEEIKKLKLAFPDTISSHSPIGSDLALAPSHKPFSERPGLETFLATEETQVPETTPAESVVDLTETEPGKFSSVPMTSKESKESLARFEASPRNFSNLLTERPGYKETFPGGVTVERPSDYKTYYEAHPEERMADMAKQESKPLIDAYMKLIEDARSRAQGFGLPMKPRTKREMQVEATKELPVLSQGLERLAMTKEALPEKYYSDILGEGARITPHLVRTEGGQYVYSIPPRGVNPPGVIPAGILGEQTEKTPLPSTDKGWTISFKNGANWASKIDAGGNLIEEPFAPEKHGQPIATSMTRGEETELQGILADDETKWITNKLSNQEMAPSQLKDFTGWGRVGQVNRGKIIKALKQNHPEYNFALLDLYYSGDRAQINRNKSMQASILSFEKTAIQNAKQLDALSRQINVSRIPILNSLILSGETLVGGTPVEAQYIASWRTLVNEYARVATSVTGGGITSDTARKEIETILRKGYTPEQVQSVIRQLVLEMEHRRYGFEKNLYDVMSHWGEKPQFEPQLPTAEDIESIFKTEAPLVGEAGKNAPLTIMAEKDARDALKAKGILGAEQDKWIDTYKKAGKVR